jgi:hypothetical protein
LTRISNQGASRPLDEQRIAVPQKLQVPRLVERGKDIIAQTTVVETFRATAMLRHNCLAEVCGERLDVMLHRELLHVPQAGSALGM